MLIWSTKSRALRLRSAIVTQRHSGMIPDDIKRRGLEWVSPYSSLRVPQPKAYGKNWKRNWDIHRQETGLMMDVLFLLLSFRDESVRILPWLQIQSPVVHTTDEGLSPTKTR
jgi:hypothetical protein